VAELANFIDDVKDTFLSATPPADAGTAPADSGTASADAGTAPVAPDAGVAQQQGSVALTRKVKPGELQVRVGYADDPASTNLIFFLWTEPLPKKGPNPEIHWLQFMWLEILALNGGTTHLADPIRTTFQDVPATTNPSAPVWRVDSQNTSNPFYVDSGGDGILTAQQGKQLVTAMFDRPGLDLDQTDVRKNQQMARTVKRMFQPFPNADRLVWRMHFKTFVVRQHAPIFCVVWNASTTLLAKDFKTAAAQLAPPAVPTVYDVDGGASAPVTALNPELAAQLKSQYPNFKL
jgi:hypothetical protein